MTKKQSILAEPFTLVDIPQITKVQRLYHRDSLWAKRLTQLPDGKAMCYEYNNRQRAQQVARTIRGMSKHCRVPIKIRTYHGIPEIHGTDQWLLYVWRKKDGGEVNDKGGL